MVVISIVLILVCIVLGFLVLIQNPKGGGLAGNMGGLGQQMMGVQQSTDTVEKGTWIFAATMGILCLITVFFNSGKGGGKLEKSRSEDAVKNAQIATPAPAPAPAANAQTSAPANGQQQAAPANGQKGQPAQQTAPTNAQPTNAPAPAKPTK